MAKNVDLPAIFLCAAKKLVMSHSLLNFKEPFFNYLNLGGKVADFSERNSQILSCLTRNFDFHFRFF